MKHTGKILAVLTLLLAFQAQALECEVEYLMKKTNVTQRWFGAVKESKVKSGTLEGQGETKKKCREDALSEMVKKGWEVISEKTTLK